jgi:hypothetical protein
MTSNRIWLWWSDSSETASGISGAIQKDCGCGPAQQRVEVALKETRLTDFARTQVLQCLNDDLPLDEVTETLVSGKVDGCVRKEQTLEPKVRDGLIAVVSDALAQSNTTLPEQDAWVRCYADAIAPPERTPPLAAKYAQMPIKLGADRLSLSPPETAGNGKKLYRWTLWVRDLNEMLLDLKQIYYSFDHPTFEGAVPSSTKADNSFRVEYRGWGCVRKVTATLVFKDDSRLAKSFDQCAEMPDGTPQKGGGFGSSSGEPPNMPHP